MSLEKILFKAIRRKLLDNHTSMPLRKEEKMTNDNPKCPVCLTVQTGAHTCKRAKPLRDKCTIHLKEVCEVCEPFRLVPKPQAVEIRKDCQEGKVYGFNPDYMKKEVEPSVEDRLRERIKELEGRLVDQAVTICEISKVFAKKIAELERKE